MRNPAPKLMLFLSLMLTVTLFITPATAQVSEHRITLEKDGNQLQMPYFRNFPLDKYNPNIQRAVIVHHGASRNPDDYFSFVENAAQTVGCQDTTIIIAPHTLTERDLRTYDLDDDEKIVFFSGGWRQGDNSLDTENHPRPFTASNYEFYDEMLTQLADRQVFPNLKKIVFTGHSAGGQVTNRYAAGTKVPDTILRPAGIEILFVVANPSSYVYFSPERRVAGTLDQFALPTAAELEKAPRYNRYIYGMEGLNDYMSAAGVDLIYNQYQRREVYYLLGEQDRGSASLDSSASAMLEGSYRYERGRIYHNYVQHVFGPGTAYLHKKAVVMGLAHDGNGMYNSQQGLRLLFDYDPQPEPIERIKGSLVLTGGGEVLDAVWDRFMALAGGEEAKIVVIPTANPASDSIEPTRQRGRGRQRDLVRPAYNQRNQLRAWRERNPQLVSILHTRDFATANNPEFVAPLKEATGVWFEGGIPHRLTQAYLGTLVEKELYGVIERGGVIGAESYSAAAMSRVMIAGGGEHAVVEKGFDMLPGAVTDQHFTKHNRKTRLHSALASHPQLAGFGIDENTAMIVYNGRRIEVLGAGTVTGMTSGCHWSPMRYEKLRARQPRANQQQRAQQQRGQQRGEQQQQGQRVSRPAYTADLMAWSRSAQANQLPQFPAQEPPVPEVMSGSLMIVGGGGMSEDLWQRFIELAGGPDVPIVAIPTAGGLGEVENPNSGGARSLQRYGATNVTVLHTTIRDKSNYDEDFLKPLKEAQGVWFDGGRQWNLVDSYQNTTAHELMMDVLARGGVIGGSSAGASIQGDFMARGDPLGSGPIQALGYETGLGFLVGVGIDQHFHQRNRMPNMTGLMATYPQILGIGLDESTAIIVKGTIAEIVGRNVVSFYDRRKPVIEGELDHQIVNPGQFYDLKERRIVDGKKQIREIRVIKFEFQP